LLEDIAAIDENIELFLPERKLLGDLEKTADIDGILSWLEKLHQMDKMVLSLDTIAYGGLIPSRRSPETFEEVKSRIEKLKEILKNKNAEIKNIGIFGAKKYLNILTIFIKTKLPKPIYHRKF